MRAIEEMTEREMLEELLEQKRREQSARRVKLGITVLVIAALCVLVVAYLPPVVGYFRQLGEAVRQIQQGLQQITGVLDDVDETVSTLRESGFDTLRNASQQLTDLLERLPGIFR